MNLALYGGGCSEEVEAIDRALLDNFSNPSEIKMTFIPSCSYFAQEDYNEFIEQYEKFNIHKIIKFEVDMPYSEIMCEQVFSSDIIHLGGGNTFYFIKHLRKNNFLKKLKDWVRAGGVLTGLSAGAIIMTPSINTASFPDFDKDDNEVNIKNMKGMSLASFEFFPHYKNSKRYDNELIKYSKQLSIPLYACPDGSGILQKNGSLSFVGKVSCFFNGKKFSIN